MGRPKLPLTRPNPLKAPKPVKKKDQTKKKKRDNPDENNWTKEFTQEELNELLRSK